MDQDDILVVEGEPDLREAIRMWLKHAGFKVLTAADADEGLLMLHTHNPSLVVVNEELDQLTRYGFIRKVRGSRDFSDIPILAVIKGRAPTGNVLNVGADAVITIPEAIDSLAPTIERLLSKHNSEDEEKE
jgi:DNA-binding response OmpR family regulator